MIEATNSETAQAGRFFTLSGSGQRHYRTDFLGRKGDPRVKGKPQAYMLNLNPGEVLLPHFHIIDQFQVFFSGNGTIGRNSDVINPVAIHYADHHTGYGPITAGDQGFSYFTLRPQADPGAVYLHKDGYREKLRPSRKRHHMVHASINPDPAAAIQGVAVDTLVEKVDREDAGISIMRLGANAHATAPAPGASGGQYCMVLTGSLQHAGNLYPPCSILFVHPDSEALELQAGADGLEVVLMEFPSWRVEPQV